MSITDRVASRTYRGIWALLRKWFRVSEEAPTLPAPSTGTVIAFRPAEGYLRYLTFQFWFLLLLIDGMVLIGWIAIAAASPKVGAILAIPALIIAIVPDIFAYVALQLRYDTTWYVMSDRSLRLRHGVMTIREMTFTFENVQNVSVSQGPLQRYFGIASVVVQTAGGGSGAGHSASAGTGHVGTLEGIADAEAMRDTILDRVKSSRSAGLGDDRHDGPAISASQPSRFGPEHVAALREIRDIVAVMR